MRNLRLVHSTSRFEYSGPDSTTAHDPEQARERLTALERRRDEIERALPPLDPAVQTMVEHVRIIPRLPPAVRARALARARAVIAALG